MSALAVGAEAVPHVPPGQHVAEGITNEEAFLVADEVPWGSVPRECFQLCGLPLILGQQAEHTLDTFACEAEPDAGDDPDVGVGVGEP